MTYNTFVATTPKSNVEDVTAIYKSTYSQPPYNESDEQINQFKKSWDGRCEMSNFKLVLTENSEKKVVGMAYGWESVKGDAWNTKLSKELGEQAERWLESCFEFVDISVLPSEHGKGVGSLLLNELFKDLDYKTAILLTHKTVTKAQQMYERKGWVTLSENFEIAPGKLFIIMGKEL